MIGQIVRLTRVLLKALSLCCLSLFLRVGICWDKVASEFCSAFVDANGMADNLG